MISMDKKYTLNGKPFTVSTVSKPGPLPVMGYDALGNVSEFTSQGHYGPSSLVEVSPYADFLVDEKVMVRDLDRHEWKRAYFIGTDGLGFARASSFTSWIRQDMPAASWNQCRRPTAEELAND